jgi:LacI family transcriptional regulator
LRDVAAAAECHFSTVSLALRNDARLPRATCDRVQDVARRLGYVADPMLASLSSYRNALRPIRFRSTLAWVTNFPTRQGWRVAQIFEDFHQGALERAAALGYKLETFWLRERGMTAARATQILCARNITGLIIAPQPQFGAALELEWPRFSAVTIGYSLGTPALHLVSPNQYRSMRLAFQQLAERGCQRIGLAMLGASDDRVEHAWLAGYLVSGQALPPSRRLPPLFLAAWNDETFGAWVRRCRPDAIITKNPETVAALRRLGGRASDTAVALITVPALDGRFAGIDENSREIGAVAVDYVAGMIHRNERGVPAMPQCVLIDGTWAEGRTVPRALV